MFVRLAGLHLVLLTVVRTSNLTVTAGRPLVSRGHMTLLQVSKVLRASSSNTCKLRPSFTTGHHN
jgi:hypothetical protein